MNTTPLVLVALTLLAMDVKVDPQEKLAACRQQIDSIDQRIGQLIQDRARVVQEVDKIENEAHLPVAVPIPEEKVTLVWATKSSFP